MQSETEIGEKIIASRTKGVRRRRVWSFLTLSTTITHSLRIRGRYYKVNASLKCSFITIFIPLLYAPLILKLTSSQSYLAFQLNSSQVDVFPPHRRTDSCSNFYICMHHMYNANYQVCRVPLLLLGSTRKVLQVKFLLRHTHIYTHAVKHITHTLLI